MAQNDFFANFRKLQKKLPICKKNYAEILHVDSAIVKNVEKKSQTNNQNFFTSAKVAPDCSPLAIDCNQNYRTQICDQKYASKS